MADLYRLVFRGELIDDQHPAVVRRKLGTALKLDDAALDKLFSGRAVVLRKSATADEAARLQALFKKSGARLRVVAAVPADTSVPEAAATSPAGDAEPATATNDGISLMPSGADVLTPAERSAPAEVDIDTAHLSLDPVGTRLAGELAAPVDAVPDVDFDVADLGTDLHDAQAPVELEIALEDVDFGLAEPGAVLDTVQAPEPPPAPDTSHLTLENDKET